MKSKNINFFTRVKKAIFDFDYYQKFALEDNKKTVKYLLTIIIIFTIIVGMALTYRVAYPNENSRLFNEYYGLLKEYGFETLTPENTIQNYSIVFVMAIIIFGIDILILSVLAFFTARIFGMKLKYKVSFNIGIYSLTLSIILSMIYLVLNIIKGITIEYFEFAYNIISYIYVVTAIILIRQEIIKQQIQVARIVDEEKRIRKEREQEEREEEERQKEDKEENKEEDSEVEGKEAESEGT